MFSVSAPVGVRASWRLHACCCSHLLVSPRLISLRFLFPIVSAASTPPSVSTPRSIFIPFGAFMALGVYACCLVIARLLVSPHLFCLM